MRYPYDVGHKFDPPDLTEESDGPEGPRPRSAASPPQPAEVNRAEVLRGQLNGARVMAPLYRAVLVWPGMHATREAFGQAFKQIAELQQATVERVRAQLEPGGDHPATAAMLSRPIAELVGYAWGLAHEENANPDTLKPEYLAEIYTRTIDMAEPTPERLFDNAPRVAEEKLSEANAVAAAAAAFMQVWVLRPATQRLYIGERSQEDLIGHLRDVLFDAADDVADRIGAHLPDHQRAVVYRSALGVLADLYRSTLDAQFLEITREIQRMDDKERGAYLASLKDHPDGVLVERTDKVFAAIAPQCYPADVAPGQRLNLALDR